MEKLNWNDLENGVYAVAADGTPVMVEDADESCIAVALIVNDAPTPQRIMIAKEDASIDEKIKTFYWGGGLGRVKGIIDYFDYGYLPKLDGTYQSTPNLSADYTTWMNGVLSDFSGKSNTQAIIAAFAEYGVGMTDRDMCKVLQDFNNTDTYNDWYVPSTGQLALIYLNKTAIDEALTKIGGVTFASYYYWSSSEYSSNYGFNVSFSNGYVFDNYKRNLCRVRAIRDIQI